MKCKKSNSDSSHPNILNILSVWLFLEEFENKLV